MQHFASSVLDVFGPQIGNFWPESLDAPEPPQKLPDSLDGRSSSGPDDPLDGLKDRIRLALGSRANSGGMGMGFESKTALLRANSVPFIDT